MKLKIYIIIFTLVLLNLNVACELDQEVISSTAKPDSNRFTKLVVAENLDQPMQMDFFPDGRIIFVEREGAVKVYSPKDNTQNKIAAIPVSSGYYYPDGTEKSPVGEDGMQGVVVDPNWSVNHWIYLYYSPKEGNSGSILSRFYWDGGEKLDLESEIILLEVPNHRNSCCHLGGGLVFDQNGDLYLSTGDNTPNDPRGFNPIDERPGRDRYDSQRTSDNSNDLRGKILRIHPEDDGSYTIPEGNLFSPGTPDTRPEIYTMGNRNPYRLSIDSKTGWLFWGEVGPFGNKDVEHYGPKSYDEFNIAKKPGNYGWPYFSGNNFAYWEYDYETETPGAKFDTSKNFNYSPNNSGLKALPSPVPALIWYPQAISQSFPIPGSGSASALGGPVFRKSDYPGGVNVFPSYYEGKWFITDWSRGWLMVVELDEFGNYACMERFLPDVELIGPNDMKFGPDGDLYVLEYGRGPYIKNNSARLIKFRYNSGNRTPVVKATIDKKAGAAPFQLNLSSRGSVDYDQDELSYKWVITDITRDRVTNIFTPDTSVVIGEEGLYSVVLHVDDGIHLVKSDPIEVCIGNEAPEIDFNITNGNNTFAFENEVIKYNIDVWDKEDGKLSSGEIEGNDIKVNIEYVDQNTLNSFDLNSILERENVLTPVNIAIGKYLLDNDNCSTCHRSDMKLIGPAYKDIRERYQVDTGILEYLSTKIIEGSVGIWGEEAMPAHPLLTKKEAGLIANYILNIDKEIVPSLPSSGTFTIDNKSNKKGNYVFRASYLDRGFGVSPGLETTRIFELRSPLLSVSDIDGFEGFNLNHHIGREPTISTSDSTGYFRLSDIDLTDIRTIELEWNTDEPDEKVLQSLSISLYLDSLNGRLIAESNGLIRDEFKDQRNMTTILEFNMEDTVVNGKHDICFSYSTLRNAYEYELISILFRK